ncbi:hypothetical protein ANTPLA_LOCUS5601 [Anthophora plagiata]
MQTTNDDADIHIEEQNRHGDVLKLKVGRRSEEKRRRKEGLFDGVVGGRKTLGVAQEVDGGRGRWVSGWADWVGGKREREG